MALHVLGNVTEDLLFRLPRLPQPGETLIAGRRDRDIGGKGLNQALIAARCGMAVTLVAAIGADATADDLVRLLAAEPLHPALIVKPDTPTDQSVIAVAEDGENHIISSTGAADALSPQDARDALRAAQPGDTLLMQGNLSFETTCAAIAVARMRAMVVVVNPSPIRWDYAPLLEHVDTLILNAQEARALSGRDDPAQAAAWLRAAGAREIVLTLGAGGARRWQGQDHDAVPAAPARVIDTAGAGDTFCAVFVAARARGLAPGLALDLAARAAAITVSRHGTWSAFPGAGELAALFATPAGGAA
ncbi:MAG: PfkB family carbohydrate kinase [Roseinatronobacter sp.]